VANRNSVAGLLLLVCILLCFAPVPSAGSGSNKDWFTDQTASSGLEFVHFNGMSGRFFYPEVVGPGAAFLDYDNDGDLDIYLVQGHLLGEKVRPEEAVFPPPSGSPPGGRLYRNELVGRTSDNHGLRFTDVTKSSRIQAEGYGIGVAAGDVDNDGWIDLYVTNFGANQLWRNNGDGTFSNTTQLSGLGDSRLSVSAAFVDYDRDGWLDLYVVNHVDFSFVSHKPCESRLGAPEYCATAMYKRAPDSLFRNRGDGTFEDMSRESRIGLVQSAGLGVVTTDFNADGWTDIYVANDGDPNQMWINQGDGTFRDEALLAGAAVNMGGVAEASMGVDAGDFDGDGDDDLFMTHDTQETNTIYVNDGNGWFEDRTLTTGLGTPSQPFTGFGTAWLDYDNDGWLDLFVANGAVRTIAGRSAAGVPFPLDQTNQIFKNLGDGRFRETTKQAGTVFRQSEVSRGAAFGDVDNDGDVDILVANNSGPARLLVNRLGNRNSWLGLRLLDKSGRDALGARVLLELPEGRRLWRRVRTDASYASANDPRLLVGLGNADRVQAVRVHWPSGQVEEWTDLPVRQYRTLKEGGGQKVNLGPAR
jgi:hypothetical protein